MFTSSCRQHPHHGPSRPPPPELRSTGELLSRAFPEDLCAAHSRRVAKALSPHMSHRPLAVVLAWAVEGDPACTPSHPNTVYASFDLPADAPDLQDVHIRRESAGLQAWIDEESP